MTPENSVVITAFSILRNTWAADHRGVVVNEAIPEGDDFLTSVYAKLQLNYPRFYKMDGMSKAGFLASEILLKDRNLKTEYPPESVGLVLSNAHASLDTDLKYFETMKTIGSPALFVYTLANIVCGEICIRQGIKGENAFFVTEQFDAKQMCDYVTMVMAQPGVNACVAGWVDVMKDDHDVFLYLAEQRGGSFSLPHTAKQLTELYQLHYGTVDGRS